MTATPKPRAARPSQPKAETPEQWRERVLAEHGPPPKDVEDRIRAIVRRVNDRNT